jgi:2-phosphoglycerate kinase
MGDLIYVGGVSGVGKSQLCCAAQRIDEVFHLNSGEYKRPLARRLFGKELHNLDQEQTYLVNEEFFKGIIIGCDINYPLLQKDSNPREKHR